MEYLDGSHLFDTMFEDSVEAGMLHSVPGAAPHLESYLSNLNETAERVYDNRVGNHAWLL